MVAAGLQEKFSWKSVAASAVSAAVSDQINTSIQGAPIRDGAGNLQTGADGQILRTNTAFANYSPGAARVTSDFISGVTGAYSRHGITNGQINFRDVAAESLGNAIGNEIVGGLVREEQTSKRLGYFGGLRPSEAAVAEFDDNGDRQIAAAESQLRKSLEVPMLRGLTTKVTMLAALHFSILSVMRLVRKPDWATQSMAMIMAVIYKSEIEVQEDPKNALKRLGVTGPHYRVDLATFGMVQSYCILS